MQESVYKPEQYSLPHNGHNPPSADQGLGAPYWQRGPEIGLQGWLPGRPLGT
jgi:hypothetical protein